VVTASEEEGEEGEVAASRRRPARKGWNQETWAALRTVHTRVMLRRRGRPWGEWY
jgi:hypothetical protein